MPIEQMDQVGGRKKNWQANYRLYLELGRERTP
jgi:hypothetical protein